MNSKAPTLDSPTTLAPRLFQIIICSFMQQDPLPPLPLLFSLLVSPLLRDCPSNGQSAVTMAAKDSCRHLWLFSFAHLPKDGVVIWCFFTSPSLADPDHESQPMGGVCGLHPELVMYARSLLNTDAQGSVGEILCNQESLRRESNLKTELEN